MDDSNTTTATETTTPAETSHPGATPQKAKRVRKAKAAKPAKVKAAKKLKTKKSARKAKKAKTGSKPMEALKVARKDYVVDKDTKTAKGNVSVHCGDKVAKALAGVPLEKVMEKAAKIKEVSLDSFKRKYSHLNDGAKRMVAGNIIRAAA